MQARDVSAGAAFRKPRKGRSEGHILSPWVLDGDMRLYSQRILVDSKARGAALFGRDLAWVGHAVKCLLTKARDLRTPSRGAQGRYICRGASHTGERVGRAGARTLLSKTADEREDESATLRAMDCLLPQSKLSSRTYGLMIRPIELLPRKVETARAVVI